VTEQNPIARFEPVGREVWGANWRRILHSPITQAWEYGEAKREAEGWRPQRFVLHGAEGDPVGLLQVLVRSVPLLGQVARINRGPVLFADIVRESPSSEDITNVMVAVRDLACQERWKLVRIIPEFAGSDDVRCAIERTGFAARRTAPVGSAVLDLNRPLELVRKGFDGKWRNALTSSEKAGIAIDRPPVLEALSFLVPEYELMQREKGFHGIPSALLWSLGRQAGRTWAPDVFMALHGGQRIGAVMAVRHGDTCTYLVGWSSPEGRRLRATYLLL